MSRISDETFEAIAGYAEFCERRGDVSMFQLIALDYREARNNTRAEIVRLTEENARLNKRNDFLSKTQEEYRIRWIAAQNGLSTTETRLAAATTVTEQLADALGQTLEWIDAVPRDTALPAMPGFDRDTVDDALTAFVASKQAGADK